MSPLQEAICYVVWALMIGCGLIGVTLEVRRGWLKARERGEQQK